MGTFFEIFENIKNFINGLINQIKGLINRSNVSSRDKRAIKLAGWAVFVFFVFMLLKWLIGGGATDEQKVVVLRERLKEVKELKSEYDYSTELLKELTASIKKEEEALLSVVERILIDNDIERKSFSIKDANPSGNALEGFFNERAVQVDIKKITLQKTVDLLYSIQSRDSFLKVSNLKLRTKFGKENSVDISFRLSTFEFNRVS